MTQDKIVAMFDNIAPKYDFVNRILSMGIDKSWRKEAVKNCYKLIEKENIKIVDVACGTGDMIEIWKQEGILNNKNINIVGVDPSKGMLNIAKKRFPNIVFQKSFATNLPFENNSVDVISISFGIRNVLDIEKAIEEFYRVLTLNGILIVLEFTKENKPTFVRKTLDFYTNKILPQIGGVLSRNKTAYTYLPDSIQNFYTSKELETIFIKHKFKVELIKDFNLGQVGLFLLRK